MESIRDRVRGFLVEFESPHEKDIQEFVSEVASENPSLDIENFKKKLIKVINQREELQAYEKELKSVSKESPFYNELESVLKEAKEGNDNLEDIFKELKTAKKISKSIKSAAKKEKSQDEGFPVKPDLSSEKEENKRSEVDAEISEQAKGLSKEIDEIRQSELETKDVTPGEAPQEEKTPEKGTEVLKEGGSNVKEGNSRQEEIPVNEIEQLADEIPELLPDEIPDINKETTSVEETFPKESEPEEESETKKDITEKTADEQSIEKEIKGRKKKGEMEDSIDGSQISIDEGQDLFQRIDKAQDLLHRLDMDDTRTLLKDQLTPEKQAVFEILEQKLMSDVETRIKKLKEIQTKVLEEKPPQTFIGKIKTFLTKEDESVEAYDPLIHGPLVTFEGMEGFNEIERYWVNEPYAFVVILFDPENNVHLYYVAEPILSEFEDLLLREIKDRLKDVLLVEDVKLEADKDKILTNKVRQLIKDYAIDISPLTLEKILYYARRDYIKFGKIDPLMHDNRIEDISANGHDIPIYLYHKKYTNIPTNIYYNENDLNSYVIRLAQRCNKHISIAEPMVDATMPDGSRIQMTIGGTITSRGATFTIRKFSETPITPIDLVNWNTFSAEGLAYLWLCIENNKSLIFAGGTASGKTSSLNAVSLFIPAQAKIVTLEDTRELKLPHPNWIPGVTRDSFTADGKGGIDMYELLRAALRQRPEYLLVGEVRGKEALTLFQAMSTGHTTFSTMHADSVASAIHRLENPPISVPRTMIQALNIISIQAQTYVGGKRSRRNMKLVEITDIDPTSRNIRTNDIFVWDPLTDKFIRTGESKALNEIMIRRGWSLPDLKKELMNRQKIIEFMVNNKITDFNAISTIIHDYQATPEKILTKLNITADG